MSTGYWKRICLAGIVSAACGLDAVMAAAPVREGAPQVQKSASSADEALMQVVLASDPAERALAATRLADMTLDSKQKLRATRILDLAREEDPDSLVRLSAEAAYQRLTGQAKPTHQGERATATSQAAAVRHSTENIRSKPVTEASPDRSSNSQAGSRNGTRSITPADAPVDSPFRDNAALEKTAREMIAREKAAWDLAQQTANFRENRPMGRFMEPAHVAADSRPHEAYPSLNAQPSRSPARQNKSTPVSEKGSHRPATPADASPIQVAPVSLAKAETASEEQATPISENTSRPAQFAKNLMPKWWNRDREQPITQDSEPPRTLPGPFVRTSGILPDEASTTEKESESASIEVVVVDAEGQKKRKTIRVARDSVSQVFEDTVREVHAAKLADGMGQRIRPASIELPAGHREAVRAIQPPRDHSTPKSLDGIDLNVDETEVLLTAHEESDANEGDLDALRLQNRQLQQSIIHKMEARRILSQARLLMIEERFEEAQILLEEFDKVASQHESASTAATKRRTPTSRK